MSYIRILLKAQASTQRFHGLVIWLPLLIFLGWGWRVHDLFNTLPAYGDVLEVMWVIEWYQQALSSSAATVSFYPHAFYPDGWQVATFAQGPGLFLLLLPLDWLGGPAFAYNSLALLTFVVAYGGTYRLARMQMGKPSAVLVALLFTFWGFRWSRVGGHLNILAGTSLLPWLIWLWERGRQATRPIGWYLLAGGLWGLAITQSLYFIWLGAVLVVGWVAGRLAAREVAWRTALRSVGWIAGVALLVAAPAILWYLEGHRQAGAVSHDLHHINGWGASVESLVIPYVYHPWLGGEARARALGFNNEANSANLGVTASLVALGAIGWGWRKRALWPALLVAALGLLLALGPTLKVANRTLEWVPLHPLDYALWLVAHLLKPELFPTVRPSYPFDIALPMPWMGAAILIPFWEGARTVSRFALVGALGVFWLVAWALEQLRPMGLRVALCLLLLFELVPPPTNALPLHSAIPPVFEWLNQQTLPSQGVLDVIASQPDKLDLYLSGSTMWAMQYHGQAIVAGTGGILPEPTIRLSQWLGAESHPLTNPELIPLLQSYRVRFLLLHLIDDHGHEMVEQDRPDSVLPFVACFDPAPGDTPWYYPICVFEVPLPSAAEAD